MIEIKARVKKGYSKAALDMIVQFCADHGFPAIPLQRGIFDERDTHYALVWMNLPEGATVFIDPFRQTLFHLLDATFTNGIDTLDMEAVS